MPRKRIIKLKQDQYKKHLSEFKRHIEILGYSKNGQAVKHSNVLELLEWLESGGINNIKSVRPVNVKAYYEYLKERPHRVLGGKLSLKTIAHSMQSLRTFFSFLQERGDIIIHPMSTLKFKHPSKRDGTQRVILTQGEIKELYAHCEWLHERVILSLAYGCGLRNGEIATVNIVDVKINDGILIVPNGKGNKRRVIPMSSGVVDDARNYYENERSQYLNRENEKAFLLNIKGDRMQGYTCRKILSKIIARTENQTIIDKNIALHNLRHSIATHLLERGVNVEQVRNFLGHAHIETTEIYTRVNQEQLKKLIQ